MSSTVQAAEQGKGTVNVYEDYLGVLGTGTHFDVQAAAGDIIEVGGEQHAVSGVFSGFYLEIEGSWRKKQTGSVYYIYKNAPQPPGPEPTPGEGQISFLEATKEVVGTGTYFKTQVSANDAIIAEGEEHVVSDITDDTRLTTVDGWGQQAIQTTYSIRKGGKASG